MLMGLGGSHPTSLQQRESENLGDCEYRQQASVPHPWGSDLFALCFLKKGKSHLRFKLGTEGSVARVCNVARVSEREPLGNKGAPFLHSA